MSSAQSTGNKTPTQPIETPILENDFVRVRNIEIPLQSNFSSHLNRDAVVLPVWPDEPDLVNAASFSAISDEVKYYERGSDVKLEAANVVRDYLLIELKQHWEVPVKRCEDPLTCTRAIGGGAVEIGETRSLFSNGFINASIHRVGTGGSLQSSYYSNSGEDHIVYIALTKAQVNFAGIEEELKAGQVYFSSAPDIETTARDSEVTWVVVRIHMPKTKV